MSKPFFSVVIPTRNRAELLKNSIQTVLEQTFADFEVVVSNNFSSDNTKEIIKDFNDERIRYFETDRLLNMQRNFDFALSRAQGEYITFLPDDDAFSAATLELLKETIEKYPDNKLIVWNYCDYLIESFDRYGFQSPPDVLYVPPFDGRISIENSRNTLLDRFAFSGLLDRPPAESSTKRFPAIINAMYNKSLFEQIKQKNLRFLHPECSVTDVYSLVILLHTVEDFVFLDYPLHIHGAWQSSSTTTIDGSKKYYKASEEELLVPVKCYTNEVFAANAMMQAKNDVGDELDYIEIDWTKFFPKVYRDVMDMKSVGVDVSEDLENFDRALSAMPEDFQEKVRANLPSNLQLKKNKLIHNVKRLLRPVYSKLGMKRRINEKRRRSNAPFFIAGEEAGFKNILECARMMDRDWLEKNKIKS